VSSPRRFIPDALKLWTDPEGRPIAVIEVTWRTICGLYLLAPTRRNTDLLLGVLGKAQDKYDFQIYALAFLSNHGSMMLGVRSVEHLSEILRFVGCNIPKEIGCHGTSRWKGKFWGRRARAILIRSEERLLERLTYIHANSVKEILVKSPTQWPGAHSAKSLCYGSKLVGTWYERAKLWASGKRLRERDVAITYEIRLAKLPHLAHLSDFEYQKLMEEICAQIRKMGQELRKKTGKKVWKIEALRAVRPHFKPDSLKRSPAPPIHADEEGRKWFLDAYATFLEAYQLANHALKCAPGVAHCFPEGGILPGALMTT